MSLTAQDRLCAKCSEKALPDHGARWAGELGVEGLDAEGESVGVDGVNIKPGERSLKGCEGGACQKYFANFKGKLAARGLETGRKQVWL